VILRRLAVASAPRRAAQRAKVNKPKLGWHSLRRSYASLLLATGASRRVSMDLMRHSTADMTLARYAQAVGDEKRMLGQSRHTRYGR
jgi:integrase